MSERPDLYNLFAASCGVPAGWRWYSLHAIDGTSAGSAALIEGAVCTVMFSRGPWKGTPNWKKRDKSTERKLVATREQLDAVRDAWEVETGKCSGCGGSGQEVSAYKVTGKEYRDCRRCNATGAKP